MKNTPKRFDSLFRTELIFLLDSGLKIHSMIRIVQQREASSAKAFCLVFDEERGEKDSDEMNEKVGELC